MKSIGEINHASILQQSLALWRGSDRSLLDYQACKRQLLLGCIYLQDEELTKAIEIGHTSIDSEGVGLFTSSGFRLVAEAYAGLGEIDRAIAYIRRAYAMLAAHFGVHDSTERLWLVMLEQWLNGIGQTGNAMIVRGERSATLDSDISV